MKIIVLDSSKMKEIFEGCNDELLSKLISVKNQVIITTTLSSFMNAVLISKPNIVLKNVQKILKTVKIQNDDIDFTNSIQVNNKIAEFVEQSKTI